MILRTLGENTTNLNNGHSIPNNPGLKFFQKSILAKTMSLIVIYNNAKIWKDPLGYFGEKAKNPKNGHIIIYNPGQIFSSEEESSSNNAPYWCL